MRDPLAKELGQVVLHIVTVKIGMLVEPRLGMLDAKIALAEGVWSSAIAQAPHPSFLEKMLARQNPLSGAVTLQKLECSNTRRVPVSVRCPAYKPTSRLSQNA